MKFSVQTVSRPSVENPVFDSLAKAETWIKLQVATGGMQVANAVVWDSFENKRWWEGVNPETGDLDQPWCVPSEPAQAFIGEILQTRYGIDVGKQEPFLNEKEEIRVCDPTPEFPDRSRFIQYFQVLLDEVIAGWPARKRRQWLESAAEMARLAPYSEGGLHPCHGLPAEAERAFDRIANGLDPHCSFETIDQLIEHKLIRMRKTPAGMTQYAMSPGIRHRWEKLDPIKTCDFEPGPSTTPRRS